MLLVTLQIINMNADQDKKMEGAQDFELVQLTPEQHPVTPVPKFTTELPFFYLTKQKQLLQQDIHYEGIDAYGNPIRWDVIPNRSPKIGVPAIEAHTIFTQLVKPVIERSRAPDGHVPEIIPLGGIRQCLRAIGWKEGGWEARGLLQGLMQIGQATCDFDFLLPVGNDSEGKLRFKNIKGIFNRFSIWKIGSKHVSEDDLVAGNFAFDFDLDDTLYIQLHVVERDIQRHQDQRYLDNQYMFSVEARARRWYELLAAKIFGVVKNKGTYCEIKYSWYIKHHHTLMRLYTRSRVVSQMNRIVGDHLASGFITKSEYRAITDEDGKQDFIIRYYPGKQARESVNRVLSFININPFPILIARQRKQKQRMHSQQIVGAAIKEKVKELSEEGTHEAHLATPNGQEVAVHLELFEALTKRDVMPGVATSLLVQKSAEDLASVRDYIDYWDSIRNEKRPGLLVRLIQNNEPLPPSFETRRKRTERLAVDERQRKVAIADDAIATAYKQHYESVTDRFIADTLTPEGFERRVEAYKKAMVQPNGLFWNNPTLADKLARSGVRAEIGKELHIITFENFRERELLRILSELQFDPVELGIEVPPVPPSIDSIAA